MFPGRAAISLRMAVCIGGAAISVAACDGSDTRQGEGECGGKCDSKSDLLDALDGRDDPFARWLRTQEIRPNGTVAAEYADILFGVAKQRGCAKTTIKTFVISDDLITGANPFPRLISTVCSNDPNAASEFFISASFEKLVSFGEESTGEVDTRSLELFAWDDAAKTFRFYATDAFGSSAISGIRFEVEPERCRGCHLTPADVADDGMHMLPIMNELTRPWSHWNAQPGFPSHHFEVPSKVLESKTFADLVEPFPGSAAELEPTIRAGQDRAALARLRARRNSPPSIGEVMTLLRPLFCDEQVNYVSEEFDSGIMLNAVMVDPGVRNTYLQVKPDWPWDWLNQPNMRIGAANGAAEVILVPVRGNANALYENQLMSLGALTAEQVVRVRALDWETAALSSFRCKLWKDAVVRFDDSPPALGSAERNSDAMPIVFDAILQLDGKLPLKASTGKVLVLRTATSTRVAALRKALQDKKTATSNCATDGFCELDMIGWGDQIDAVVKQMEGDARARDLLLQTRNRRLCEVVKTVQPADDRFDREDLPIRFNNRPALPAFSCF